MKINCCYCDKEEEIITQKDERGNNFVDIQDKISLKIRSTKAIYVVCKECAEFLKLG